MPGLLRKADRQLWLVLVKLPLASTLVMAAIFGFGGSIISLLLSKTMAKRATGAQVIVQPRNEEITTYRGFETSFRGAPVHAAAVTMNRYGRSDVWRTDCTSMSGAEVCGRSKPIDH